MLMFVSSVSGTSKPVYRLACRRAGIASRRRLHYGGAIFARSWRLLACVLPCAARAHDIPNDVRVQMFVKPAGDRLQLLVRVPLAAMREVDVPRARPRLPRSRARRRRAARRGQPVDRRQRRGLRGRHRVSPTRSSSTRAYRSHPTGPSASYEEALAHLKGPRLPESMDLYWNQQLLDVLFEYPDRVGRIRLLDPSAARAAGTAGRDHAALPAAGRRCAPSSSTAIPGLVRLDPRWHQAALRFVESGFPAHPGRHRPPALHPVPRDPVPAPRPARADRHRVHRRALDHADLGRLRPRALRAVVSAAHRDADRALHPLHGAREHRRQQRAAALDHRVRVRSGARLRLLVRAAGDAAVRGLAPRDLAPRVQRRRRARPATRARACSSRCSTSCSAVVVAERIGTIILSAFVAHTAWHWMLERCEELRKFPVPALDAAALASAMRWLMAALVLAGLVWLAAAARRADETEGGRRKAEEQQRMRRME